MGRRDVAHALAHMAKVRCTSGRCVCVCALARRPHYVAYPFLPWFPAAYLSQGLHVDARQFCVFGRFGALSRCVSSAFDGLLRPAHMRLGMFSSWCLGRSVICFGHCPQIQGSRNDAFRSQATMGV